MTCGAGAALALLLAGCMTERAEPPDSTPAGSVPVAQTDGPNLPMLATGLGQVQAFIVTGNVDLTTKDGTSHRLVRGEMFTEGSQVRVGPGGGALLILSNGTMVKLYPFGQLLVTSFRQEPFDEKMEGTFLSLRKDPSQSSTILYLCNEIAQIEVKPLNVARGSRFEVDTPVGDFDLREGIRTLRVSRNPGGQLRQVLADCLVGGVTYRPMPGISINPGRTGDPEDFVPSFDLQPAQQLQVAARWEPVLGYITGSSVEGASIPLVAANAELENFNQTANISFALSSVQPPSQKITVASRAPAGIPTVPFEPLMLVPMGNP